MPNIIPDSVSNFLVPGTGSPNAYALHQTFTATPYNVDFSQVNLNGLAFRPSGVIIDNNAGNGDLKVLIPQMSYLIVCPKGAMLQMPYPAPLNHTASIQGDGVGTVIFVDYPLIPYSSVQATSGGGGSFTPPKTSIDFFSTSPQDSSFSEFLSSESATYPYTFFTVVRSVGTKTIEVGYGSYDTPPTDWIDTGLDKIEFNGNGAFMGYPFEGTSVYLCFRIAEEGSVLSAASNSTINPVS